MAPVFAAAPFEISNRICTQEQVRKAPGQAVGSSTQTRCGDGTDRRASGSADEHHSNKSVSLFIVSSAEQSGLQRCLRPPQELQGPLHWRGQARPCPSPLWLSASLLKRTASCYHPHQDSPGVQTSRGPRSTASTLTWQTNHHPAPPLPQRMGTTGSPQLPAIYFQHYLRRHFVHIPSAVTAAAARTSLLMWRQMVTACSCVKWRSLRRKRIPSSRRRTLHTFCWEPGTAAGPAQHPTAANTRADIPP